MVCPHCTVTIFWQVSASYPMGTDETARWSAEWGICPNCSRVIVQIIEGSTENGVEKRRRIVVPRSSSRPPAPPEVPSEIRVDYEEACQVLEISPKASAALSRRCLQSVLRDGAGVTPGNLATEIDKVIEGGKLQSTIAESLDAVREIGNFAAHPSKSVTTGEIVEVEPDEAEWNLDVLEALFDVFYIQPKQLEAKKAALNAKLKDAGKAEV
jgi:hypothetical protein